jgi:hypothetical protein
MRRQPIRRTTIVEAQFVCSDEACEATGTVIGPLGEIDSLGCTCDAGLQILGWPSRYAYPRPHGLIVWFD